MSEIFTHPCAGAATIGETAQFGIDNSSATWSATGGRGTDIGYFRVTGAFDNVTYSMSASSGKVIQQASLRFSVLDDIQIAAMFNNSGDVVAYLQLQSSGALRVHDANDTSAGTSATSLIATDTWYGIAMEAEIGSTSGTVRVWIGNDLVLDLSGVDLDDGGGTGCDKVYWGCNGSGLNLDICQMFVYNTSGSDAFSAFIGDKLHVARAVASDNDANWATVGSGSANYDRVDDATTTIHDGDTTALETGSLLEEWHGGTTMSNLSGVIGLKHIQALRKTDSGAHPDYQLGLKASGGTKAYSPTVATLSESFDECQFLHLEIPGGGALTLANINASFFGGKTL